MSTLSSQLRSQIYDSALAYAVEAKVPYYESLGSPPTLLFECNVPRACHGNFHDESYRAILASRKWQRRLEKPHSRKNALPEDRRELAKELDSSTSSDALLMNCFCYPGAAQQIYASLIPEGDLAELCFGARGQVPLGDGVDDTEIDLWCGNVIFESKLTEPDFTSKSKAHLAMYGQFLEVFDAALLPQTGVQYDSYQLIRNVLATARHKCNFRLICDARRPDLLRAWWRVYGAIIDPQLRMRCGFLLWQEIAQVVPPTLQEFLRVKYGLLPPVAA